MAHSVQQYQPISNADTGTYCSLTVRFVRDMADNINNTKRCVQNFKVRSLVRPSGYSYKTKAGAWSSQNWVTMLFAPVYVPDGYTNYFYSVCHKCNDTGSNVVWSLYSSPILYTNSYLLDTEVFDGLYHHANIISNTNTYTITTGQDLKIIRDRRSLSYLMMTAMYSNTNVDSRLYTVDIWPVS